MTGTTCKQAGDHAEGWDDRPRHLGLRGLEVVSGDVPGLLVGALHVEGELHGAVGAEVGAGAVSEKRGSLSTAGELHTGYLFTYSPFHTLTHPILPTGFL